MTAEQKFGAREWIAIAVLLLNLGGMVWSAAVLSASTKQLEGVVADMNLTLRTTVLELTNVRIEYNARLAVLETLLKGRPQP